MPPPDRPATADERGATHAGGAGGGTARTPGRPGGGRPRPAGAAAAVVLLLALAVGAAGWWRAGAGGPGPGGPGAPRRWIRDDHGQRVAVPAVPRRVACLAPELCAILEELLPDQAVVPVEPGEDEVERLRAAAPDLVLLPEVTRTPGLARRLRATGMAAATVRLRRVTELPGAVARVGAWLGRPARGRALAASYGRRLARVAGRTQPLGPAARPPVLVLVWNDPPVVAGPASPVAELVALAGGRLVPQLPAGGPVGQGAGQKAGRRLLAGGLPARAGQRLAALAGLARGHGGAWIAGEAAVSIARGAGIPPGTRIVTPLRRPGSVPAPAGDQGAPAALYYLPPGQLLGAGPEALTGLERLAVWLHPRRFPGLQAEPPARLEPRGTS
ncbi:MAG TPA: ABC transporter substrate-binding protein [Thermaerobacter sp.]